MFKLMQKNNKSLNHIGASCALFTLIFMIISIYFVIKQSDANLIKIFFIKSKKCCFILHFPLKVHAESKTTLKILSKILSIFSKLPTKLANLSLFDFYKYFLTFIYLLCRSNLKSM